MDMAEHSNKGIERFWGCKILIFA